MDCVSGLATGAMAEGRVGMGPRINVCVYPERFLLNCSGNFVVLNYPGV